MSKLLQSYYVDDPLFDPSVINEEVDNFEMHIHTKYSAKDALCNPDEYCKRAKELGYTAVTATEHGVLYSVVEMAQAAKKHGLKFIPGCEVYETNDRTHHARAGQDVHHFLLMAANDQGYKDLMRIVSDASTIGKFDDNERTDFDFIEQNDLGKNLIATSACLGGRISQMILSGDYEGAKKVALRLKGMFYQFYLELQDNEIKDQGIVNMQLIQMSKDLSIPVVLTSDIHYVYPEDGEHHDTLICIGFNNKKNDPNRYRYEGDFPYYLRSPKDKYDWAKKNDIPLEAIYNTKLIAEHCNVVIPMGLDLLPLFPTPTGFDAASYMERLCYDSLQKYAITMHERGIPIDIIEYLDRLNMETKVIRDKNYPGYFLTLWDFVQFLARENIFQGPGRGSAAGSLVAYLLDITKLDPIIYDLQFERFLNPERNSMPDIDIDIPDIHRPKCIDYIKTKYGSENVAQIMTFGEIGVKSGIRDLVRVLELDPAIANEISELIPAKMPDQSDVTLKVLMDLAEDGSKSAEKFGEKGGIVEIAKRFKGYMEEYPEIYDSLKKIEGSVRNKGIHAGGVIICKDRVANYAPVEKGSDTAVLDVCAFPMGTVEEIGLLKMDFLGLRTLSVVAMALEMIEQNTGNKLDMYAIGRDDKEVYTLLREGHTHAVFQVSGSGITHYTKQVKPTKFNHLIDILALFRPGPLEAEVAPGVTMCDRYVENGDIDPEDYMEDTDVRIRHIMEKTRAVLIYQEQIMAMVREMAGYTLGAADSFRRIIGKKKIKEVSAIRWQFLYGKDAADKIKAEMANVVNAEQKKELEDQLYIVEKSPVQAIGAIAKGWSGKDAEYWFQALGKFAGYGFNKSHSAAYADLAYQTAWLKVHYPVEFMTAQLTSEAGNSDKTVANLGECKRMGIKVLPPDINKSSKGYTIDSWADDEGTTHPAIRMGLLTISGIGEGVIDEMKNKQSQGNFQNFDDFISRVSGKTVNKNKVETLILAGCFDESQPNRYKLLNQYFFSVRGDKQYNGTVEEYKEAKKSKDKNLKPKANEYPVYDPRDFTDEVKLDLEKDYVGVFVSGHPLGDLPYKPWVSVLDGEDIKIGGRIKTVRKHKTKGRGDLMCFFKLETQAEELDCTVFPRDYADLEERTFKGAVVVVKGVKQVKDGREGILVDKVLLPKMKHRVERDLEEDPLEFMTNQKGQKKQQQLFENEDLPPLTPKADPLAALFGE